MRMLPTVRRKRSHFCAVYFTSTDVCTRLVSMHVNVFPFFSSLMFLAQRRQMGKRDKCEENLFFEPERSTNIAKTTLMVWHTVVNLR